jgi:kumamolisin
MTARLILPGSERPLPADATAHGPGQPLASTALVEVSIYLRSDPATEAPFDPAVEAEKPPGARRYLSVDAAEAAYGAAACELGAVRQFAMAHGLTVTHTNRLARRLRVSGSADRVAVAFGVSLKTVSLGSHAFRTHDGPVTLPTEIAPFVEAVFGLDNRPFGAGSIRLADPALQSAIDAWHRAGGASSNVNVPSGSFLPPQVAALYDFPTATASGQTVAVFAFNDASTPGGYETSVLESYFRKDLDLAVPHITDVTVLGPGNTPGDGSNPNDASPEIYLDLSIVGSLATGAKIAVYFTEFTEQGWVDALTEASTDTTQDPDVISISYGNPENGTGTAWTTAAIQQVNQAFASAAARGKTITAAAGDNGATDGVSSRVHVDFPASSPWVLACGGTRLAGSGSTISSETVWNDLAEGNGATGGGISEVFALPSWQSAAKLPDNVSTHKPGRGVPDVASLADPQTPFIVAQPGGPGGVGGTSAAAPLWASLLARVNAGLGSTPVGFLNPHLYGLTPNPLRDITVGSNKAADGPGYEAGPGWDACTGLGSPGGAALAAALAPSSAPAQPSSAPAQPSSAPAQPSSEPAQPPS